MAIAAYNTLPNRDRITEAAAICERMQQALGLLRRRLDAPPSAGPDYLMAALVQHVDVCCFTIQAACHPLAQGRRPT